MAAKKKAKKKQTKSGQTTRNKMAPMKKTARKKLAIKGRGPKKQTKPAKPTRKKKAPTKKTARKKPAIKGQVSKKQSAKKVTKKVAVKAARKKPKTTRRNPVRSTILTEETSAFPPAGPEARSGGQSGDLQGLSSVEGADSESVVELLEEGNAFEAAVVAGVENAETTEPEEVRTHEVLEDDVPDEYLDRE